jgi:hypothetical protein
MRERTRELLEPMALVARMIEGHLEESLAHWPQGFNDLFSAVKRRARGYRTVEYVMLFLFAGKLSLPCY